MAAAGGVHRALQIQRLGFSLRACLVRGRESQGGNMKDGKTLALVGAALMFVGAFMPIVSAPLIGSLNYFQNGRGDGVLIVVLAIATAALALTGRTRHVLWTGIGSLALLAFTFIRFQSGMAEMRSRMDEDLADNPFRGLAEAAVGSVQLQWGWAVLVLGAGLVVYAGWQARQIKTLDHGLDNQQR